MQTQGLSAVQGAFRAYGQQFVAGCEQASETIAQQVTAYDKGQHRWRNVTGEAERQIACRVEQAPGAIRLVNAHGVPYGKWLELAHQGRFAILLEALRAHQAAWLQACARAGAGGRAV